MENLSSTYQIVAFLKVCTIACSNCLMAWKKKSIHLEDRNLFSIKNKKNFQFFRRKELTSKDVVVLWEGKDCVHLTNVSDDLKYILGLEKSPMVTHNKTSSGTNQFEDKPVFPTDVNFYYLAFVYCDIIKPQFVGNTKAPLLRSFPSSDATQIGPEKVESSIAGGFGYPAVYRHSFDKTQAKLVNKN